MKLILPSFPHIEAVSVHRASLTERAINKLFPSAVKFSGPQYVGRTFWSKCRVQYDCLLPPGSPYPNVEKQDVVFGNKLYLGLKPCRVLGMNVYECTVDCVQTVIVGEI